MKNNLELELVLIYIMNLDDVESLRLIQEQVNMRVKQMNHEKKWAFKPGDKVKFKGRDGMWVHGVFKKRTQTRVDVDGNDGVIYRITPAILEKDE